jgi:Beta-lactamase
MNTTAEPTKPTSVELQAQLQAAGVKGITIDETKLRAHVIRPAYVASAVSDSGIDQERIEAPFCHPGLPPGPPGPPGPQLKHLDVKAFGDALHAALKDSTAGYVMRLREHGTTIYTLEWNWARYPADGGEGWNPDVQMHVASVSKLLTAMGMTRTLDQHQISYDTKIIEYLPTYWVKGPNIGDISFRNLMTHTSGFNTGGSATDFATMKEMVAKGVNTDPHAPDFVGHYRYQNMNFGLCRILMSVINGNIAKGAVFPANVQDAFWDFITILGYDAYLQQNVFTPSEVAHATLGRTPKTALAYQFPAAGGWDSGDLASVSGGAGWHVSVDELLDTMGTFRRKSVIMPHANAQNMLDSFFGIDEIADTAAGRLYNKNGAWGDGSGREEQTLAYFLPQDMELVVMANSPVGSPAKFFRGVVDAIYLANLK